MNVLAVFSYSPDHLQNQVFNTILLLISFFFLKGTTFHDVDYVLILFYGVVSMQYLL